MYYASYIDQITNTSQFTLGIYNQIILYDNRIQTSYFSDMERQSEDWRGSTIKYMINIVRGQETMYVTNFFSWNWIIMKQQYFTEL